MRTYRYYILISFFLYAPGGMMALAQDVGSPSFENYNTEFDLENEKLATDPTDPPKQTSQSSAKDTSLILKRNVYKPSPVIPKDERKVDEQDDDSVLSFNFLYYLIQKYKMQDIVD